MLQLDFAAVTHRGVVRKINEDAVVAVSPVFCVADGIGGSDAGEIASGIVAREFTALAASPTMIDSDAVNDALQRAHREVLALSARMPRGAASTAAGCIAQDVSGQGYWLVFNIGDSRVYRCSGPRDQRRIKQITVDHSFVQDLVDAGSISKAEAYQHPRRNVVTRAVGASDGCQPDFWLLPMVAGERMIVCSDGLLGDSPPDQVRELIKNDRAPHEVVGGLLQLALISGARDNVSVIVIDVGPDLGSGDDGGGSDAHQNSGQQRGT